MLSSIRQLLSRFARAISVLLFVGLVGCSTGGKDHTQEEPTPDETGGYGTGEVAMKGTPATGFSPFAIPDGWGTELESEAPQPDGCAF